MSETWYVCECGARYRRPDIAEQCHEFVGEEVDA
jgi:hypothetical protein